MSFSVFLEILLRWLAVLVGGFLCVALMVGCESMPSAQTSQEFLKQGQARGHLTLSMGGSLLSAGMKQTFHLGPENVSMAFDGDVDFSETPLPTTASPSTSVP